MVGNRFMRWYRRSGRRLNFVVAALLLAVAVIVATAYTEANVNAGASVVVSPISANSLVAVQTFSLNLEPERIVLMSLATDALSDGEEQAGDGDGGDVDSGLGERTTMLMQPQLAAAPARSGLVCGQVTNNTGRTIRSLAAVFSSGSMTADGRVTLAPSYLEKGETAHMLCDLTGLEPGHYAWSGYIVASWQGGEAEVPFGLAFTIPEPQVEVIPAEPEQSADDVEEADEVGPDVDENAEAVPDAADDSADDLTTEDDADDQPGDQEEQIDQTQDEAIDDSDQDAG